MAQPPSPTSPTRRNFWSAYAQRAEDYTTHDLPNFSFGSPGTSASGGSSRSLSVSDGYGGESEGSGEIEEEGESHERVPRGRSMKIDTTPRPSVAVAGRSHQSQVIHSTPTKHPSSLHSSSRSPPINELNALNRIDSGSGDHHHPEEINDTTLSDNADYHPNVFHDQEHDYNESDYYSSGDEEYIIYSDDGSEPDIEVSSARYDPDGSVEGPAINPRLIPSIHSSGSRSTSIRRKGSSATESYWSGKSGYGSVTGRKGSVVSDWSYGAGSGIEGRQQDYYSSEELALPPSEHTSVSGDSHIPSSGEDWRRLLGPVQVTNIGALGSPDSPHFAVPSELNDDASVSASSRADAASDFDIPYITQFDQPPDFVSIASGATGSTSISSPAFSSVSILSLPSSSGIQSFSGSSISGSVAAASGSLYTHHYSQSRSTMDSFGSGDRPMPLPPFLQQHLYQQGKKSLPGAYQTPWELMNKTPFSKSPLNAGNKGKARERPPSMMSALSANSLASSFNFPHDDTFARSLNTWGGQNYRDLRKAWVFRRERSGSHHGSSTSSSGSMRTNRTGRREVQLGMTVPSQERWNNFLLGRFVVIREEVGREGVVGASPPKSLSKPSPDSQKSGSKKGLDKESLNTESSARAREKGKAKEESWGDGQSEQKPVTDPVLETRSKLKNSKSKSSAHSQAPTLAPTTNQSSGTSKPQQQRIVIRRLRDKASRGDKIKTGSNTTGSAASSTTESHTSPSSTSPASTSTAVADTTGSPTITVSLPESKSELLSASPSVSRSASTVSRSKASSSKDDNLSSKEPTDKPSALTHIPSHPLGYDPLHPAVIVHKHSRVAAFSVSRHHRSSVRAGGGSAAITHTHARSRTVIMLAQKSVQEAFTNTETTKKFMETALLMNFDGPKKKEKTQREKSVIGLGSGSEKGKRKEREREKGKSKPSRDNLRLKIRSEGQVHLSDEEGKSPLKSSGSSRSRLAFPRSPSKVVGTKSAPANVNGEDEVDVEDNTSTSGDHSNLHRRASSSVLPRTPLPSTGSTAIRSNTSTSNEADEMIENEPVRPLRPKYPRADDYHKGSDRNSSSESSQPPRGRRTSNSSLFRRLIPWTDAGKASSGSDPNSSPSSNTLFGSSSTSLGTLNNQTTAYLPPWVTFPTREQQEQYKKAEDAMGTLKWSFENVGLLPSSREGGDREREKTKDREKRERRSFRKGGGKDKDRENDVLNTVPHESLLMLLPLWPGETDAYSQHYYPYEMPLVPPEERMFLLVYYKVLPPEVMNVNQRNPQRPILDKRNVHLPSFHIIARQVPYTDLEKSGIRLPDQGLAVSGPLETAYTSSPKRSFTPTPSSSSPSLTGELVQDCLMGSCYSRETGIEFDPEALLELGLCSVLKEDAIPNPLPAGRFEEEFERSITVKLTAIGSAVVEMVWAGSLALTSFAPVGEGFGPVKP